LRLFRRTVSLDAVQAALCWAAAQYIRLVWITGRWRIEGDGEALRLFEQAKPLIIATWHGRLMMTPFGWRHSARSHVLVSAHRDGQLIARTLTHFRTRIVIGSTRRGGVDALRKLHRLMQDGGAVGITPDGPRGPRMRVSPGIVQLARLSGAPIFPLAYSVRPRHVFETWDRFILPLPFGRGVFLWGAPMTVPREADDAAVEAARRTLEDRLNELTHRADDAVGQPQIEPAPSLPAGAR
jgi:lysophospholipid acyltransferase (LPLAT)-like uncharacterized protein